jgi:hypothetical protein
VDGGHPALPDAEAGLQDLRDRREAVGRARRVRDDDLGRAALLDVLDDVGPLGVLAGRLDDDRDAEVLPGELADLLLGQDLDLLAVDEDAVLDGLDVLAEVPRTESYFSRWARVLASVMSLTATYSTSGSFQESRSMFRPIRPKPLMPIRIAMRSSFP